MAIKSINLGKLFPKQHTYQEALLIDPAEVKSIIVDRVDFDFNKFFHFQNLNQILIYNCKFKNIPDEIYNIPSLDTIAIDNNPELKNVDIPKESESNISTFSVTNCLLQKMPDNISALKLLKTVVFEGNEISEWNEDIFDSSIEKLNVSRNNLLQVPKDIGNLVQLMDLYLFNNQISSIDLVFANGASLHNLYVFKNKLEYFNVDINSDWQDVNSIYLADNKLTVFPECIRYFKNLRNLSMSYNPVNKIPEWLFSELTNLEELNLSSLHTSELSTAISNLRNLRSLTFADNNSAYVPDSVFELSDLEELDLSSNNLERLSDKISNLDRLETLDVSFNNLSSLPKAIYELPELQSINLLGNSFTTDYKNMIKNRFSDKGIDLTI